MYVCMYGIQEINKSPAVPERLLGDGIRIEHVIGNLVSNAIKFCPEDSVITVDISLEPPTNDSKIEIIGMFHVFACNFFEYSRTYFSH